MQALVSRKHRNIIKRLFELEVPEIFDGQMEIKAIARELRRPGSRTKVAVWARQEGIDPIGACVGVRGESHQQHHQRAERREDRHHPVESPIRHSSSPMRSVPSNPLHVELRESDHTALVEVEERQLSLAIGKEGQNARLAAR